ncbi:MAG TPA: PD-(D/E)XK nuclease family protein [Conexibacter sp.]|nr:PD-(D/E)XK nuclease family protein [Conexibacter sp.]
MTAATAPFIVEPPRFSMSFMRAAEGCLRRADMERKVDLAGPDATVGRFFHCAMAAIGLYCSLRGIERPDRDTAIRIAKRAMAGPDEPGPLPMAAWETALDLVDRWLRRSSSFFRAGERFEIDSRIPFHGRILSARIDRLAVDGRVAYVGDYKSGWADPADALSPQGRRYAWHILVEHAEVDEVRYTEDHARTGLLSGPWVIYRDELPAIEDYLRAQIDKITAAYANGALPAKPGAICSSPSRCPVASSCPVPDWARPDTTIETHDDAVAAFEELLVCDQRREAKVAAIRGYIEDAGLRAIEVGGQEIGFGTRTGRKLNRKRLAADLGAHETSIDLDTYDEETRPTFGRRRAAA